MTQERIDALEQKVAELEENLTSAMMWVAVLSKQDFDLLRLMTWQTSKSTGRTPAPPLDFPDDSYKDVVSDIIRNAAALNDFLSESDATRGNNKGAPE